MTKTVFILDGGTYHYRDRNLMIHPYFDNVIFLIFLKETRPRLGAFAYSQGMDPMYMIWIIKCL